VRARAWSTEAHLCKYKDIPRRENIINGRQILGVRGFGAYSVLRSGISRHCRSNASIRQFRRNVSDNDILFSFSIDSRRTDSFKSLLDSREAFAVFLLHGIQYLSVSFKHAIDLDYYLLIFNLNFRGPPSRNVINPSFLQLPSSLSFFLRSR